MLHLHAGAALEVAQLLQHARHHAIEVRAAVLIVVAAGQMQLRKERAVRIERFDERRVGRQSRRYLGADADADAGFVRPQTGYVAGRVAAPAQDEQRDFEGFGEFDAGAVGTDIEVKAAQAVAAQGVGAALEDNGGRVIGTDTGANDVFE